MNSAITDFSLSGVKTFKGMEGTGFNATLKFKGKIVAEALDDAHGGEMRIRWVGTKSPWEPPAEITEYLQSPPAVVMAQEREKEFREEIGIGKDMPLPDKWGPTDLIEYLLDKHEQEKTVKRAHKRYGLVFHPKESPKSICYFKVAKDYKWTRHNLSTAIANAKKVHGEIVVLAAPDV